MVAGHYSGITTLKAIRFSTFLVATEHHIDQWGSRHVRTLIGLVLVVLTGCASTGPLADLAVGPELPHQIANHGGSFEGHTPRGFAGSGTGLFAGDNLNPNFPDGDGVQIWLSFQLPFTMPVPEEVILRSDALNPRGTPFADLGALLAEPVVYDEFGPENFDLASTGEPVTCIRADGNHLECDVTDTVTSAIRDGLPRVQFRLKFETVSDGDGQPDLARFFRNDPNANEPGLFVLDLQ